MSRGVPAFLKSVAVFGMLATAAAAGPRPFAAETYELGPCLVTVAVPEPHGARALIVAHGSRPVGAPLSADLDLDDGVVRSLLKQGWIVAATSYRRNGDIFHDAVIDVRDLAAHLRDRHGVEGVVVEGWSLGAGVATKLAEEGCVGLLGVLGIEVLYSHPVGDETIRFAGSPNVPLLLLSNRDEARDALLYGDVPVWVVDRHGHCNVNVRELAEAHAALADWIDGGPTPPLRREFLMTMHPTSTARAMDDGLAVAVREVDAAYGNVLLELTLDDLALLGANQGDTLSVIFAGRTEAVPLATTYADVEHGAWVAFTAADGWTVLARNTGSAAVSLGCAAGDTLLVAIP